VLGGFLMAGTRDGDRLIAAHQGQQPRIGRVRRHTAPLARRSWPSLNNDGASVRAVESSATAQLIRRQPGGRRVRGKRDEVPCEAAKLR